MRYLIVLVLLAGCADKVVVEDSHIDRPDNRIEWMKPGTNDKVSFKAPVKPVDIVLHKFKAKGKPVEFKPADTHSVVGGECLWFIAEYKGVYDDPFRWTEIYKANRHQISNPDLIYPGQELIIPRQ